MKKLFKKLLAVALVGAMVGFVGCKDYDDDIDALNNRLDGIENGQIKTINDQIATMQSSISSLQSAQSATQAAVDALEATVATLETKADHAADVAALETKIADAQKAFEAAVAAAKAEHAADKAALEAAIAALEAAHEADVKAVMAEIAALQATDADLKAQIAANEESIAALEAEAKELDATIAKIEESMKEMATMSWVEATLEAYATSEYVAKELGELWATLTPATMRIADLESQMTENNLLDQKQQEAIDAAAAALEALEAELEETKKWVEEYVQVSVAEAGMKLWAKYLEHLSAWVYPDIDALYLKTAETEKALADAYAALEKAIAEGDQAVKAALSSEIDNLQNERAKLEIALKAADEELQKQIDALKGQVAALQALVGETPVAEQIKKAIEENNGVLDEKFLEQAEKIAALKNDLDKAVEDLRKQLLAANINIEALMNRIQSIVYVPDYEDLMATVPGIVGFDGDLTTQSRDAWLVGEGEVYMNFRVTPANLAMKVAAVGKEHFKFMLQGLKTRAAEYGLEVLDVAYNPVVEDGLFTVVAQPTLPLEFYQGAKNYAVSLVLDVTNAEVQKKEDNAAAGTATSIMTSYVKLYADTYELEDIKPGKVVDGDVELVYDMDYTIDWDDTKTKIELLKGYEPYLVFDNADPIPYAKAKMMYTLPELTQRVMSNVAFDLSEDKDFEDLGNFVFADENEDACEEVVSLAKPEKKFLGDYLTTEHVYGFAQRAADEDDAFQVVNGGFVSQPIFTKVTIVKPTRTIELSPVLYYWWYQDFKKRFDDGAGYEGMTKYFNLVVDRSEVSAELTDAAIIAMTKNETQIYDEEAGKYVQSTLNPKLQSVVADAKELTYRLSMSNWKFNNDYQVRIILENADMIINVDFDASFVGLPEKLTYSLGDVTIPYKAGATTLTTEVAKEDKGKALEAIYAQVGADKEIKKYFAKVDEFVSLVTLLDGTKFVSTLDIDATRVSGGDEETATVVTDVTRDLGPAGPNSVGYSGIMQPNTQADLFDAFFKVYTKDVVTDADVFTMNTTVTTQPGMKIEFTGSAAIEMPAYRVRHSKTWVADPTEENNFFHSYVKGLWGPSMDLLQALTSFSTADIELESAFILQELKDGEWQDAASTPAGVSFKYTINEKPGTFKGIEIDETTNFLTYNGTNESVNVVGELFVDHVKISDAFNYPTRNYLSYRVFKYDPLGDLKEIAPVTVDINTAAGQGEYTYNIWASLSIKDLRGAEIVNRAAAKKSENMWMNENYSDEFGKSVVTLFGIDQTTTIDGYTNTHGLQIGQPLAIYQGTSDVADGLEGRITITDGRITFSNLNNLAIQRNVEVRVPVKVLYTWGEKEGYVTYIIQK